MSQNAVSELGRREFTRWFWRQLTSMRTALFLLLLLAIAAVPGSLVPQRGVDARAVETYFLDHPTSAPILDKLGFFSVYSSPWFSSIYLLLMVSLVGCILPRTFVYFRAMRARPPKAPRNFARLPASASFETSASDDEVMAAAQRVLGRSRVDVVDRDGVRELSAEKGFGREAGNLVFHVSIVVVLVGVAFGSLFGYRGSVIVTEGDGFSNVLSQYDEFSSGALFSADDLPPFSLSLDKVTARFQPFGSQQAGAPREFRAQGTYITGPGKPDNDFDIQVNHPLTIGSTSVYLVGQGYAPVLKITDADGNVEFEDAVAFLPTDSTYTSNGVLKLPDAKPDQLGFQGFFLPTAADQNGISISVHPAAANPIVSFNVWHGDLGLDDGSPQSVFILDKSKLKQYKDADGKNVRISLSPGQVDDLPGGGTIEYVETAQFARFQISSAPLVKVPLIGIVAGLLGLMASLTIKPRRTWIRSRREGSRTVVDVAVLDRVPRDDLPADLDNFLEQFKDELGDTEDRA
ncbi:cytochrome c biogenesis protein ResB [Aeromicrobium sp. UC242_57]|uniref:cytochrome c biogenesis protein ResB n=1 Tax=Aeromicrobium sp. UC242_57 TaxID=3374624 RepID=UPI0037993261